VGRGVRELLHDGHPTACVGDAAFGCVNAFRARVQGDATALESLIETAYRDMKVRLGAKAAWEGI